MLPDDLAQRLKRLNRSLPAGVMTGADLLRQQPAEREYPDIGRFVPGEVRKVGEETCFVSEEWFPFDQTFGTYPLANLRNVDASALIQLFGLEPGENGGNRILFLDTETTGLAGGTGTYAFLVGVGSLEEEGFKVVQYFMRDYDEEPAQMTLLAEDLKSVALLVTYNGATFDMPLLKTRFVFNRVRFNLQRIPHLDLLPVARRLWKRAHGAANLSHLEARVLGSEREGDVPGSLIPTLYFHFLRGASPRTLAPVFYHNRMDIVALAALTECAWRCHTQPEAIESLWERLGVARSLVNAGQEEVAMRILEPVLFADCGGYDWHSCSRFLAALYKRSRQYEQASTLWWRIYQSQVFDPEVMIDLAKYLEHIEKDIAKARELVCEIFQRYDTSPEPESGEEDSGADSEEDLHYDYSEWKLVRRGGLPVRRIDQDDEEEREETQAFSPPRWSERMARELNHRLRRLNRKLAGQ